MLMMASKQMDILHHDIYFTFLGLAVTGDNDDAVELVSCYIQPVLLTSVPGFSRVSLHKIYETYAPFG